MSSAPASLSSPAASEAFAQPASVSHGVSDRLSSGIFQPLQLDRESQRCVDNDRTREGEKREKQRRAIGGSLNPLAKEFVPVAELPLSGHAPNMAFGSQFVKASGAGNKGSAIGNPRRPRGGQNGPRNRSVIFGDVKNGDLDDYGTKGSVTTSSGGLSRALERGSRRAAGPVRAGYGDQSSAMIIPGGQASTSSTQAFVAGTTPPGNRKSQVLNANHLLNFQYDPIRAQPRVQPRVRRPQKSQPYNKELFLQANFRFLVSDMGDYMLNTADPDKMLEWEDVAAVSFTAPVAFQCPICLDPPLCPQITMCGHIFCFPCVLRYLLMGDLEVRSEHWKRCPLCSGMISSKELRTVSIDNVHEHCVGDRVKFTLLTRAKGSIIPFEKTEPFCGSLPYSTDGQCHLFSKFTLTSVAEPVAEKSINELTLWAERVEGEGGEDMELLPFVFAAIDKLQQRKDAWKERRCTEFLTSSPAVRQRIMTQSKAGIARSAGSLPKQSAQKSSAVERDEGPDGLVPLIRLDSQGKIGPGKVNISAETEAAMAELRERAGWVYESAFSDDEDEIIPMGKEKVLASRGRASREQTVSKLSGNFGIGNADVWEELMVDRGNEGAIVSKDMEKKHQDSKKGPGNPNTKDSEDQGTKDPEDLDGKRDAEERDSYTFYQSDDGQTIVLHPLNVKCLMHHYGSYEALPMSLEAEVLELETLTQTEMTRKRYRYLSHLPLTAVFQLCEVDLSSLLPRNAFIPFLEDIRSREGRRRRILKQEKDQKALEDKTVTVVRCSPPTDADFSAVLSTFQADEGFSNTDVEDSLGSSPVSTMSPPEHDERKLFSSVAKLGFASGYDAPDLMAKRPSAETLSGSSPTSSSLWSSPPSGMSGAGTSRGQISFADMIAAQSMKAERIEGLVGANKVAPKKGKKASKVIMSTAGGRRY